MPGIGPLGLPPLDALGAPDLWHARLVLQRGLALIYLIGFLVALQQFRPLLGERGLLPVPRFLAAVPFRSSPSLFHLVGYSDRRLVALAVAGAALAAVALAGLPDAWPLPATIALWAALWVMYLSLVNIGQAFYSFGWETLLLEAGFLAIWLGPAYVAPPLVLMIAVRWLLFRVELGAGLIKWRGDPCWRDLTCLYYHHETQPLPNPLSWWFHRLPRVLHRAEVLGNHVAQLVLPFGLFLPPPVSTVAAVGIAATQAWLVLSGNFSWLNAVTLVLALASLDGEALGAVLPARPAALEVVEPHAYLALAVAALIVVLSVRPARNLVSRRQKMNASFEPLHLVNTYGAFGSITKERYEIVVEGTEDAAVRRDTDWREYEFIAKPGDVRRRPPQVAPYHLRLDWLMWFAAMSPPAYHPWFARLAARLLEADRPTLRLLSRDPFDGRRPRFVRALLYRYRFTTRRERRETGAWWSRELASTYLRPISLR